MYNRVLVPIDGSHASTLGLMEAINLVRHDGARLRLIHIVDELIISAGASVANYVQCVDVLRDRGKSVLADSVAAATGHGVNAESELLETMGKHTGALIVEQARRWGADLIVMGTHGRRGVRRILMGSDAEEVLRTATVPVLMVREQAASV